MNAAISASSRPGWKAEPLPHVLKVGGITPFSATDYPGKLAAVVFVRGCAWRCGYCHNPHLQPRLQDSSWPWQRVLDLLGRRVGLLDAVVFSGGEPTTDAALRGAIVDARALGFAVGLHTGGIYPRRLAGLLPLLDWVGLDVKAPFERYRKITGIAHSGIPAQASLELLLASGVAYEIRTTAHPDLLDDSELLALAQTLAAMGVKNYALQLFRAQGCANDELKRTAAGAPAEKTIQAMARQFSHFTLRGG